MSRILVTGASGNVGRELVRQLLDADLRLLSRNPTAPAAAAGATAGGATVGGATVGGATAAGSVAGSVVGDLARPESLVSALDGVRVVFLIWPFLTADAAPGVLEQLGRGRRVVYLSSSGLSEGHDDPINQMHAELEQLVEQHADEWTILRSNTIASNARGWAGQIRSTGVVRGPDIPATAVVHERDLAAVAARALQSDFVGQRLVLTGPEVVSRAEQVAAIGAAVGRELRFEAVPVEESRAQLLADGRPPALVEALLANVGRPPSGLVTSTIEELTGSPARGFAEWAEEHADEFR